MPPPRDLTSLGCALQRIPPLRQLLEEVRCGELQDIYSRLDPLTDVAQLIAQAISDDPPIALKDGGVVRKGYDQQLDEVRYLADHTKEVIASIDAKERERTASRA